MSIAAISVSSAALHIRPARPREGPILWDIRRRALETLVHRPYTPMQIAAWTARVKPSDYHPTIVQRKELVRVAEIEGKVIAYASLRGRTLWAAYVDPSHARQGIGARLVTLLERRALRRGEDVLWVSSSISAVAFYEGLGFRVREQYAVTLATLDPADDRLALVEVPLVGMIKSIRVC